MSTEALDANFIAAIKAPPLTLAEMFAEMVAQPIPAGPVPVLMHPRAFAALREDLLWYARQEARGHRRYLRLHPVGGARRWRNRVVNRGEDRMS